MQGWRSEMEDAHIVSLGLPAGDDVVDLFAVFDGHGGDDVARVAAKKTAKMLREALESDETRDVEAALRHVLPALDARILSGEFGIDRDAGSTAVLAVLTTRALIVANVGDSRCVACIDGRAVPLSQDHAPELRGERRRAAQAGLPMIVDEDGTPRIGGLAMSRALGDASAKSNSRLPPERQAVIAKPDIQKTTKVGKLDFFVVCCDGIFEALSNKELIDFVKDRLEDNPDLDPDVIAEDLLHHCLDEGSMDNMTAIIVIPK